MKVNNLTAWWPHVHRARAEHVSGSSRGPFKSWKVYKRGGKVYSVTYWEGRISCSCEAGKRGLKCKHAAHVLATMYPEFFRAKRQSKIGGHSLAADLLRKKAA